MRTLVRCCYCVTLATVLAVLCLGFDRVAAWAATITVINTNDGGAGSLRDAISTAQTSAPPVTIQFAIPPFDTSVKIITLSNSLPNVTSSILLDGYTQSNASPNTLSNADNAVLLIEVDGSFMQSQNINGDALAITGTNSTVRGLVIGGLGFVGNGIRVDGDNNVVEGNFIGTVPSGTDNDGNEVGVVVNGNFNTIGGTTAAARNLLSGNDDGVTLNGNHNAVQGNFIGADSTGADTLGNFGDGVFIDGSSNAVGGAIAGARNVICDNGDGEGAGVGIDGTGNVVSGNFLGPDSSGTNAVGFQGEGVYISSGANTVGGTVAGAGNIISGNAFDGIDLYGGSNTVEGNFIGVDVAGMIALPNGGDGVFIEQEGTNASSSMIGGTASGARNIISGNGFRNSGAGVYISFSDGNFVQGNFIGTDSSGSTALGNQAGGVVVESSLSNTIGSAISGGGNVISGNASNGVTLLNGALTPGSTRIGGYNILQGNHIGTDMSGIRALPNSQDGVAVLGGISNTIGGVSAGAGNLISGNASNGINIAAAYPPCDCSSVPADFNMVLGNIIGADIAGRHNLSNGVSGVLIDGTVNDASENTVGGTNSGEGNVIAFNGSNGVTVIGSAYYNAIRGNSIFTNALLGIDLGADGVTSNQNFFSPGPNNLQNIPVLLSATCSNGNTVVQGTVSDSGTGVLIPGPITQRSVRSADAPQADTPSVTVDFFANSACDPSGFGEGQTYLGSVTVATPSTDSVPFEVTLTNTDLEGLYITATATQDSGDSSEFSRCLQVTKLPPVITQCATSLVTDADANCQATVPNFTTQVRATDNCTPTNELVISQSPTNGAIVGVGVTDVTITVADASTNTATCHVTFTVLDTTPPMITCPAPVTVECASDVPAPDPGSVVATDTCGAVTLAVISDVITNQICTNQFTVIRTYRATDSASNTVDCQQIITVNNTTPPAITCPADVTVNTDSNACSASNVALGNVTASSHCGDAVTVTNDAPDTFSKGTNEVVWTATDTCGNASTCTQLVIVVDNQAPTFRTINSITVTGALGSVSNAVTFASPAATDNCSTSVTVVCTPPSGSFFPYGTNTINCVATDDDGNTSSNSFSLIVVRPIGPNLTGQWIATTTFSRGRNNFIFGAFQVVNSGNASAGRSLLQFYRSTTSSTNDGTPLNTRFTIGPLGPGEAHSISIFGLKLPSGVSGTNQFLIAVTDATRSVPESDETDNVISTNPPALFGTAGAALTRFHKTIREAKRKHGSHASNPSGEGSR